MSDDESTPPHGLRGVLRARHDERVDSQVPWARVSTGAMPAMSRQVRAELRAARQRLRGLARGITDRHQRRRLLKASRAIAEALAWLDELVDAECASDG